MRYVLLLTLALAGCAPAPVAPTVHAFGVVGARAASSVKALVREMLAMVEADQAIRKATKDWNDKAAVAKVRALDAKHTARMKAIVAQHGWPTFSVFGREGGNAAFLLVQHADGDPAFQATCLPLLTAAAEAGEAELPDMAMLTDRVRMGRVEKQLYGTQVMPEDGKWVPYPIEDEANVDERRAKVGLEPLTDYLARFNAR